MNELRILLKVMLLSLLVSCAEPTEKKAKVKEKAVPETSNPLDGYVKAIDKAKNAEKKVLEAAEKQRKALEAVEQGNQSSDDDT